MQQIDRLPASARGKETSPCSIEDTPVKSWTRLGCYTPWTSQEHRSEAALGPGRGQGGFLKIFPFSMAVPDLPAFFGFRDRAFGFAPVLVSATGCACSWLPISISTTGVAGSLVPMGWSSAGTGSSPPTTIFTGTLGWGCDFRSPAGSSCFRLGAAGGSVKRRSVKVGMACRGLSVAHTSSSE